MVGTTNAIQNKIKQTIYNYDHLRFWADGTDFIDHGPNNIEMSLSGTTSSCNNMQEILTYGTHPCFYNSGTGGCIRVANFSYPMATTTITAWAKLTTNTGWCRVCDFGNSGGGISDLAIGSGGGVWRFGGRQGGSGNTLDISTPANTGVYNVWYFIAYSANTNVFKGYVNGIQLVSKTTSWAFPAQNVTTLNGIFQSNWSHDQYGVGYIADLRIYDYCLNDNEITQLWETGPQQHKGYTN